MAEMNDTGGQTTELLPSPKTAAIVRKSRGLELTTLDEMYRFAQYVIKSKLAPKGVDRAESIVVTLQMGYEVGLSPMQSLQNIAVINGRPCIWGDAVMGLVLGSGLCADYQQEQIGSPPTNPADLKSYPDDYGWRVTTLRVGAKKAVAVDYTVGRAKLAKLWGNTSKDPWVKYPDRMLKNRACTYNARDNFPDVLKGLYTDDEVEHIVDGGDAEVIDPKRAGTAEDRVGAMMDGPDEVIDTETGEVKHIYDEPLPEAKKEAAVDPPELNHDDPIGRLCDAIQAKEITVPDINEAAGKVGVKFSTPQSLSQQEADEILTALKI